TNFKSKVIGVSIKDRGGILPVGHTADAAYWFDDATGNWITSTYYMDALPTWVTNFNNKKISEKYIKQDWNTLYPIESYSHSAADNNLYEGKLSGEKAPVFPHYLSKIFKGNNYGVIKTTPHGNQLTLDFAKEVLINEQMGKNGNTDFLAVSFSSTDYVGHKYGINAIETEDTYLRMDKHIEDLLNTLDATIGKGEYTVFLSSDHGAAHNPLFLKDNKIPVELLSMSKVLQKLNIALENKFKQPNLVISLSSYQVNFNNPLIEKQALDLDEIKKFAIQFLKKQDGILYVVDMEKASISSIPETVKTKIINGYNPQRSGAIQIILKPNFYAGGRTGTSHGTWNPYDTHIPLIFMGWGIKHGTTNRLTSMSDIASTLAALLHIQEPNGNIGLPIEEVLQK
ncbi:MAG TPA: alkaline phosphatase family protein, partial [Pelobium sp.]|nr:alkaline phosphatase family protein [Pelobium sp.]